jgi:hypothetical protein
MTKEYKHTVEIGNNLLSKFYMLGLLSLLSLAGAYLLCSSLLDDDKEAKYLSGLFCLGMGIIGNIVFLKESYSDIKKYCCFWNKHEEKQRLINFKNKNYITLTEEEAKVI